MGTVPSARKLVCTLIERVIDDPTFAAVHLTAKIPASDAQSVSTDIVRANESLWNGPNYHATMRGLVNTYPLIDLSQFPWSKADGLDNITFESVRDGTLLTTMQSQLDQTLAALPFQLLPQIKNIERLREVFDTDGGIDHYFSFELHRHEGIPDWISGVKKLQMSGLWKVFLPIPSPEWSLLRKVFERERLERELASLQQVTPTTIAEKTRRIEELDALISGSPVDTVI